MILRLQILCLVSGKTVLATLRPHPITIVLLTAFFLSGQSVAEELLVYVGTHVLKQGSAGIFAYRFDPDSAVLREIGLVHKMANPFFLAANPAKNVLYAVSLLDRKSTDIVTSLAIDHGSGRLTVRNSVSSRGVGACHVAVDKTGRMLIVSHYHGGTLAAFSLNNDGSIGDHTAFIRHGGSNPHPHAAVLSPDNRFAFVPDVGLDQIRTYRLHPERGTLVANEPQSAESGPASGPRHLAFGRDAKFAYVVNETQSSVGVYAVEAERGSLTLRQTVPTLPSDFKGENTGAEIGVSPDGRFVYASNRGHDSLAVFAVDAATGKVAPVGHVPSGGKEPWSFDLDPSGRYLLAANKESHNITVFRIDSTTGLPRPTGHKIDVPSPVCVMFLRRQKS